jgi:hypothetical protein
MKAKSRTGVVRQDSAGAVRQGKADAAAKARPYPAVPELPANAMVTAEMATTLGFPAVIIQSIPAEEQRYPTVGDWWMAEDGAWHIRISNLPDWRYSFLVAIHELVEMALCKHHAVDESTITEFDMKFGAARAANDGSEPGDHRDAPYRREHRFADVIERMTASQLDVNWRQYEQAIDPRSANAGKQR